MPKTKLAKVSLTPKGAWDSATAYEALDVVRYDGSAWLAKQPSQNVEPRENAAWMQIADKGDKGSTGATGSIAEVGSFTTAPIAMIPQTSWGRGDLFAFLPADQIIIEQTVDGGVTWTEAGISDANKQKLFSGYSSTNSGVNIPLLDGKESELCGLRITITANKYNVPAGTAETEKFKYWTTDNYKKAERYGVIRAVKIWCSSCNTQIKFKLYTSTTNDPENFTEKVSYDTLQGWPGGNFVTTNGNVIFGGYSNQKNNTAIFRMTFFTSTTPAKTYTQSLFKIMATCGACYTYSSVLNTDEYRLYEYDYLQNVTFPANLTATGKLYSEGNYIVPDKQYELIEDITTTEAVTAVERSTEPDGTAYNFRKVFIVGTVWLDSSETSVGRIGIDQVNGITYLAQFTSNSVTTAQSDWAGWVELEIKNGVLRSAISKDHESYDTTLRESDHLFTNKVLAIGKYGDTIKKIRIKHYNSRLLAAGINVRIYGIRA